MIKVLIILISALILLLFICFKLWQKLKTLSFDKRSLSTKYGKMAEQFLPFLNNYPYNSQNFRFIGNPIDGLQFEDDKIVFVEFKIGHSQLSEKQKRIKELVDKRKIQWQEFRI